MDERNDAERLARMNQAATDLANDKLTLEQARGVAQVFADIMRGVVTMETFWPLPTMPEEDGRE